MPGWVNLPVRADVGRLSPPLYDLGEDRWVLRAIEIDHPLRVLKHPATRKVRIAGEHGFRDLLVIAHGLFMEIAAVSGRDDVFSEDEPDGVRNQCPGRIPGDRCQKAVKVLERFGTEGPRIVRSARL